MNTLEDFDYKTNLMINFGQLKNDRSKMANYYSVDLIPKEKIKEKIRISVTNGCNFNCFFCHNEGQGKVTKSTGEMSIYEITKIIELALQSGISSVKLTGGEPLLYKYGKHNIIDLVSTISELKKQGYKFSLSLITNGYLLKKFAYPLKQAGLDRINISLSTLSNQRFEKYIQKNLHNPIDQIKEGMIEAVLAGLHPVKVNSVLFYSLAKKEGNLEEISKIIELCREKKMDELRLYTLLWHPQFSNFTEFYHYWDTTIFEVLQKLNLYESIPVKDNIISSLEKFSKDWSPVAYPKAIMTIKFGDLPVKFETMMHGRFKESLICKDCKFSSNCQEGPYSLRVTSDGNIRGCLLSENSINIIDDIRMNKPDIELKRRFLEGIHLLPGG